MTSCCRVLISESPSFPQPPHLPRKLFQKLLLLQTEKIEMGADSSSGSGQNAKSFSPAAHSLSPSLPFHFNFPKRPLGCPFPRHLGEGEEIRSIETPPPPPPPRSIYGLARSTRFFFSICHDGTTSAFPAAAAPYLRTPPPPPHVNIMGQSWKAKEQNICLSVDAVCSVEAAKVSVCCLLLHFLMNFEVFLSFSYASWTAGVAAARKRMSPPPPLKT